ncbi:MAG: cysteine desulfurase [Candidatus Omnitrophica bacterium]|nr:cysteine desulfurase [Candidatus Omnitrophota bacterium]
MQRVYLDHNATTPLHPEVKKIIVNSLDVFGNPSSMHSLGREARKLVEEARGKVAHFIGADPEEVFFVGSGTEANNTVLSLVPCSPNKCHCPSARHEIITTAIEHPCILEASKCIRERGAEVKYLGVDKYGKVDSSQLEKFITNKTGLVSVMLANNEIGTIQDIKTLAKIAHKNDALFHTDAVQAVGKMPINVKDLDVDFLTISAHKLYGPKGVGALYVKKGVRFCPLIRGGHQEKGRRAGTENTLGIIAFGKAVELRKIEMTDETKRLLALKQILKQGLQKNIADITFNGHPEDCLPGTLNVSIDGVEGESVLLYLDLEGICVSTGSACASGSLDPSHVLLATGIPVERAHGSIRISLGRETTEKEIIYTIEKMAQVVKRVREISTAY